MSVTQWSMRHNSKVLEKLFSAYAQQMKLTFNAESTLVVTVFMFQ